MKICLCLLSTIFIILAVTKNVVSQQSHSGYNYDPPKVRLDYEKPTISPGYHYDPPKVPFNPPTKSPGYHYDPPKVQLRHDPPTKAPGYHYDPPKVQLRHDPPTKAPGYHYDPPKVQLKHDPPKKASGYNYDPPKVQLKHEPPKKEPGYHYDPPKVQLRHDPPTKSPGYHYDPPKVPFNPPTKSPGYHYDPPKVQLRHDPPTKSPGYHYDPPKVPFNPPTKSPGYHYDPPKVPFNPPTKSPGYHYDPPKVQLRHDPPTKSPGYHYDPPKVPFNPPTKSPGYHYDPPKVPFNPPTKSPGYHYDPPKVQLRHDPPTKSPGYHYDPPKVQLRHDPPTKSPGYHYDPPKVQLKHDPPKKSPGYHYDPPTVEFNFDEIPPPQQLPPRVIATILGISSLSSCGDPDRLPELPPGDEQRLQRAALHLQQKLILREWLKEHRLQHHYSRLIAIEVVSLEDVYWLEDSRASKLLGKDWSNWSQARQKLPTSKAQLESLKAQLWSTVVKSSQHQDAWTWGGMLVVSVSVAGLVTLAAMTQPSLAPEARHSLLQYVTGKYLLPANCKVHWDWKDPHVVGDTMCFIVRFFQRNGQPYPICDTDQFFVEVTEGTRKVVTISELGSSTDPNNANIAKVKFTVRTAGTYKISVLIGSSHIAGSPFTRSFVPGPMDARRSRFIRPASTVVCCAGSPTLLHIEPRDEFGNNCIFGADDDPTKGYDVEIFDLHGNTAEKLSRAISFSYDKVNSRVAVTALFPEPVCLRAVISYQGQKLPNGDFDIIVLSSSDTTLVHKNIASRKHNICYEAKLLSIYGQPKSKARRVLCYVGPKQITIKEMILKFIPKRIATFRLCPSTKFHFLPPNITQTHGPVFIIDDGSQPKIELASKDRNIIAATFTHFLLKNIGGSETFKDKQDFFYHEVRKFHSNYYHEKLSLKVNREKILESSMKATKGFSVSDWCGNFEVTFQGEQGIDWGGLRREWFELICSSLFDPRGGLFCTFHDKRQALVHPNPHRASQLKLKHFEFAGKIVGKCLYESALGGSYRQLVRARFTRSFLAQLIGLRVHYKYFEQDDPDLYLSKIKYILETDLDTSESLELYFVEEVYDVSGQLSKTVELIPNGSRVRVTNSTKNQYLDALAQQRLCNSVKDEVDSFLKGLNGIIPDNLLSIFDENELELLMCGTGEYSIADFKQHHIANGNSAEFRRVLGWFWAAVSNFSQTEMARLLQFTTGCSQLPPGGFQELNPRFQITAAPTFGNLPTAHTCFNQLCLPDYESYEQFEKALLLSISEGSEGFGMV